MTIAWLQASLKTWRTKHQYRQRKLDIAHQKNDKKAIDKWQKLLVEAGQKIRLREKQIADRQPKPNNRDKVVAVAQQAVANYRRQPWAYHYLAGGVANTIIMRPTPSYYRSDCSQFVSSVYKAAGLPSPGSADYQYSSTYTMIAGSAKQTWNPKPGDCGFYGNRYSPHHVELYIGNGVFIGHGSPPIDSHTPGRPDFFMTYEFLNH